MDNSQLILPSNFWESLIVRDWSLLNVLPKVKFSVNLSYILNPLLNLLFEFFSEVICNPQQIPFTSSTFWSYPYLNQPLRYHLYNDKFYIDKNCLKIISYGSCTKYWYKWIRLHFFWMYFPLTPFNKLSTTLSMHYFLYHVIIKVQ